MHIKTNDPNMRKKLEQTIENLKKCAQKINDQGLLKEINDPNVTVTVAKQKEGDGVETGHKITLDPSVFTKGPKYALGVLGHEVKHSETERKEGNGKKIGDKEHEKLSYAVENKLKQAANTIAIA